MPPSTLVVYRAERRRVTAWPGKESSGIAAKTCVCAVGECGATLRLAVVDGVVVVADHACTGWSTRAFKQYPRVLAWIDRFAATARCTNHLCAKCKKVGTRPTRCVPLPPMHIYTSILVVTLERYDTRLMVRLTPKASTIIPRCPVRDVVVSLDDTIPLIVGPSPVYTGTCGGCKWTLLMPVTVATAVCPTCDGLHNSVSITRADAINPKSVHQIYSVGTDTHCFTKYETTRADIATFVWRIDRSIRHNHTLVWGTRASVVCPACTPRPVHLIQAPTIGPTLDVDMFPIDLVPGTKVCEMCDRYGHPAGFTEFTGMTRHVRIFIPVTRVYHLCAMCTAPCRGCNVPCARVIDDTWCDTCHRRRTGR
jgi:hypothetical protein